MLTREQTKNMILWIRVLQTRKFGRHRYKRTDGYLYNGKDKAGVRLMCCLGVACDILLPNATWDKAGTLIQDGEDPVTTTAPLSVQKLLGLESEWGFSCPRYVGQTLRQLSTINDYSERDDYADVLPHIIARLDELGHKSMRREINKVVRGKS